MDPVLTVRSIALLTLLYLGTQSCGGTWTADGQPIRCGIDIPPSDSDDPKAGIMIEFSKNNESHLITLTGDRTVEVPTTGSFSIIITGQDEGGIKKLSLDRHWTDTAGHLVQPMVVPHDFTSSKCTWRMATESFSGGNRYIYHFQAAATDFASNLGQSFKLTVRPES